MVRQFLEVGALPADGTAPLGEVARISSGGVHHVWDVNHGFYQKAIRLDAFREMDFDVVIASVPDHVSTYRKLIRDTGSRAALVFHIGNVDWERFVPWNLVDNVMASVAPFDYPRGKHVVFYRQEFDLDVFTPAGEAPEPLISSFVNCLPEPERFLALEARLPEYSLRSYGIACRDGMYHSIQTLAAAMQRSRFGYHLKPGGDGYGHVIHNWFAVGRPLLVGSRDYKRRLAGALLEDGVTCVDISGRSPRSIANHIRSIRDGAYAAMCAAVTARFRRMVDFEADAAHIQKFLAESIAGVV